MTREDNTEDSTAGRAEASARTVAEAVDDLQGMIRARFTFKGIAYGLGVTLVALVIGVVLFAYVPAEAWMRLTLFVVWLGAAGTAATLAILRGFGPYKDKLAVGRLIEQGLPGFRNDVTASLQFGAQLDAIRQDDSVSAAMVERVLESTGDKIKEHARALPSVAPRANMKPAVGMTIGALVVLFGLALFAPGLMLEGLSGIFFGAKAEVVSSESSQKTVPIVADITLNYNFPAYTRIGHRAVLNSPGNIEIVRGTEITFEAVALHPVDRAELVLNVAPAPVVVATETGDEATDSAPPELDEAVEQRILLERRPGNRLVATFTATGSGHYVIAAEIDGEAVTDGIKRDIVVHEDDAPQVTIVQPEGEIDVAPEDAVTFQYRASDDYGITELAIVTVFAGDANDKKRYAIKSMDGQAPAVPGDARPVDLGQLGEPVKADEGQYILDLLPYNLKPKDRLIVYLEVVDNDTTAGPKVAASEPVILRVSSPEDKHLELIAEQGEIVEALLDALADALEEPVGESWFGDGGERVEGIPAEWDKPQFTERFEAARPTHAKVGDILTRMLNLLERMGQDPLMVKRDIELFKHTYDEIYVKHRNEAEVISRMALPARSDQLGRGHMDRLFKARKLLVRAVEQGIIALEDLIASQRMENVLDAAKRLKEARERLKELLEKYKDTNDPEIKAEIMREIQRLKQRMQELMARLSDQIQKLPQEHVNMEALQKEGMMNDVKDVKSSLDKIQEMLDNDDLEGAMKALDEMGQQLDEMLGQMEEDFAEMQPTGLSELDKNASELMDDLNDLKAQEEEVAKETEEIANQIEERNEEKMKKMLEKFGEEQIEKLEEIKKDLESVQDDKLFARDQRDIKKMEKNAESLQKALESGDLGEAMEQAEQLESSMEQAQEDLRMRAGQMARNKRQGEPYKDAHKKVKQSGPKAKEIADDLRELMEQARGTPNAQEQRRLEKLAEQQGEVEGRVGEMQQKLGEMGKKFPMLEEQLGPGLGEAKQFMEGARERLQQQQGRKAHNNEKLALDKLGELKQKLRQTMKKEKQGQQQRGKQQSKEKVEIPEEDRSAPKAFREDIMDAMKEEGLESYESELQQYYESLVQ